MCDIIYRSPIASDSDQLHSLYVELGYEINAKDLLYRLVRSYAHYKIIIAELREIVIGVIEVQINARLTEGRVGEIVSFVISSDYRGQGIGKKLLSLALKYFDESGCDAYVVRANIKRLDAHDFYVSQGFKEIKTQKVFKISQKRKKL